MCRLIVFTLVILLFCSVTQGGICGYLKADTAVDLMIGPFVDDTDGKTAETGLTITQAEVRLSKNGSNIAQKNEGTSLTHDELGNYACKLDATDTNTEGILTLMIHESGALPIKVEYMVVNANVFDSLFATATTDYLQVDTIQVSGTSQTANDMSGDIDDILIDTSTTLDDLIDTEISTIVTAVGNIEIDTAAYDTDAEYATAIWNALTNAYGGAGTYGQSAEDVLTDTASIQPIVADLQGFSELGDKIVADMDANSLLVNWTSARAAILTDLAGISEIGDKVQADMDANSVLANGTYGLSALENLVDDIGVAGAGLTDLGGMSTGMKAEIESEVDDSIGGGTGTALSGIPSGLEVDLTKIHGSAITETTSGRFATNWNTFFDNADSDTAKTLDDVGGAAGLEVDVTKIHGTAITESTSGRIAGNFSTFWDNADAATANVVDDVGATSGGGSSLAIAAGNLGDYKEDKTVYFIWRTVAKNGAAVDPSTTGTIKVYKNDSDVEVTVDTGITDTRGFDGLTGIHLCVIDLSANSFYDKEQDYSVVLTGATIDSEIVTSVISTFSIEKRWTEIPWSYEG